MSEKLNPSPKIPNGEYPELSPNPNYTDGYIKGEHGTPVRVNTAPQRGIRQETEPTNFAELYVGGKAPLTEIPEIPTGTKLYKHNVLFGTQPHAHRVVIISTDSNQYTENDLYGKGLSFFISMFYSNAQVIEKSGGSLNIYIYTSSGRTQISLNEYPFTSDTVTEL